MNEKKRVHCKPHYKNEVSIFEKETLQKVNEFRSARSNWVTLYTNQPTNTNISDGFYESNVYKGRCVCLRRIGFKTTYLRFHHKSLRPLKYYTCRRKLPDIGVVKTESQEKLVSLTDETQGRFKLKKKHLFKKGGVPLDKQGSKDSKLGPEDSDFFQEEVVEKDVAKWFRKKKKRDDRQITKSGPSKKAIKKLRAQALETGIVESCRCDDGKELTVVIKGFCFCDKNSLNKLKLDKVRDEYSKMGSPNTAHEEKLPPPLTKAVETPEKQTDKKVLIKNDNEVEEKKVETDLPKPEPQKKLVSEEQKAVEKEKDKENVKQKSKPEDTNQSTVTIFKNVDEEKSTMALTKEQFEKMKETAEQKSIPRV